MASSAIKVDGLDELIRSMSRIDKGIAKEMRARLRKDVGEPFARDAKLRAPVKSGKLRRSIRPAVKGTTVVVRDTATNRGFNYPAVMEFAHGGERAFLDPTLDQWRATGQLEQSMEGFLDWVHREFSR